MKRIAWLFCSAALAAPALSSADDPAHALTKDELAARYPGLSPSDLHDAAFPGFYEVVTGNNVNYVSTDGRFLITGDVIDLSTTVNLSESRRAEGRAAMLRSIDPATEIVFSPADGVVKHRVTVFTDVDCGYCREFHRHIAEVNALGIEVRYVSYPRTGPNTESWDKAEGVWCAQDPKAALTRAKLGSEVPTVKGCKTSPVAHDYELGQQIGLTGTPGLYADTGEELGGYLPPTDLLTALRNAAAKH